MHREQILQGRGLRVRFAFHGDRFAHAIDVARGDSWIEVLRSVEGDASQSWPPSPPLQSLHIETRPPQVQLALLVGMAGHSHWSASVELDPGTASLRFDVACRVRDKDIGPLGSSYLAAWPAGPSPSNVVVFRDPELPQSGLRLVLDPRLADGRIEVAARQLTVVANAQAVDPASRTIRWAYSIGSF